MSAVCMEGVDVRTVFCCSAVCMASADVRTVFFVLPTVLTVNFIEDIQLSLVSYRINKLFIASVKHNNISSFEFSLF